MGSPQDTGGPLDPTAVLLEKARAFDRVRSLFWEFCDVEEGRAALRCIGEFIGEWEHQQRGECPDCDPGKCARQVTPPTPTRAAVDGERAPAAWADACPGRRRG